MDALSLNIKGIKCDNSNCDYYDMEVPFEDYDNWLDKPCPKCGMNLLTQEDYNNIKMLICIKDFVNENIVYEDGGEEKVKLSVEMNGTGNMIFKEKV